MDDVSVSSLRTKIVGLALEDKDVALEEDILSTFLVENNGTKIETLPGMGRVVISSRSLDVIGTPLIREKPALVWPASSWHSLCAKFCDAPTTVQEAVLDMFHPPLSSSPTVNFKGPAKRLASSTSIKDPELVHKLMAISNTNAHQYYGHQDVEFSEVLGLGPHQHALGSESSALFVYGSKVAHSCLPNTSYSSKTADACLEYNVIRPIEAGDLVTFSYLDKLFETPTHLRRAELLRTKSFFCECSRCIGPDYSRFVRCPSPRCDEFVTCVYNGDVNGAIWSCPACGVVNKSNVSIFEDKEKSIEAELNGMQARLQSRFGLQMYGPHSLKSFVKKASEWLSPLHYLTLQAVSLLITICASHALSAQQAEDCGVPPSVYARHGSIENLRLQAAEAGFIFVSSCECVAFGCSGKECGLDTRRHEPQYECAYTIFMASQDLMKVPHKMWPNYAIPMVKRYIVHMRVLYGRGDKDVQQIETNIANIDNEARKAKLSPTSVSLSIQPKPKLVSDKSRKSKSRKSNKKKRKGKK